MLYAWLYASERVRVEAIGIEFCEGESSVVVEKSEKALVVRCMCMFLVLSMFAQRGALEWSRWRWRICGRFSPIPLI